MSLGGGGAEAAGSGVGGRAGRGRAAPRNLRRGERGERGGERLADGGARRRLVGRGGRSALEQRLEAVEDGGSAVSAGVLRPKLGDEGDGTVLRGGGALLGAAEREGGDERAEDDRQRDREVAVLGAEAQRERLEGGGADGRLGGVDEDADELRESVAARREGHRLEQRGDLAEQRRRRARRLALLDLHRLRRRRRLAARLGLRRRRHRGRAVGVAAEEGAQRLRQLEEGERVEHAVAHRAAAAERREEERRRRVDDLAVGAAEERDDDGEEAVGRHALRAHVRPHRRPLGRRRGERGELGLQRAQILDRDGGRERAEVEGGRRVAVDEELVEGALGDLAEGEAAELGEHCGLDGPTTVCAVAGE